MELSEKLMKFAEERIEPIREKEKEKTLTEEATKTSLIMPFFQMLGYDIFNPLEFVPEYTADVGIKKGEKVDYAIVLDDSPLILIECKPFSDDLSKHGSQLFRYFGTTEAKFGILTNGRVYKFFTDLEKSNKMDLLPFLTVNLEKLTDRDVIELKKFEKSAIDVDDILSSASDLKYTRLIREWFSQMMDAPSPDFVKYVLSDIYDGIKTQAVIDRFTPLVKRALSQSVSDNMNDRIKAALVEKDDSDKDTCASKIDGENAAENEKEKPRVITTVEEIEGYGIVKSILRSVVDSTRITYRDTISYLGILLDDNNRKWICRIHILPSVSFIEIADENKAPVRYDIETLDDIYKYSNQLIEACKRYL